MNRDVLPMVRGRITLTVLGVLGWLGGCSEDSAGPCSGCPRSPRVLMVSNPVPAAAGTLEGSRALSAGNDVVYVSLPPGTVPTGSRAIIRRLGDATTLTTPVLDGGFDPLPVSAQVGDSIEAIIEDGGGTRVYEERVAVRPSRPPVVVRTDPPRDKTDVPVNASIIVVFSEPIDPATLTGATVQVLRGSTPIAGQLEFRDTYNVSAAFVPGAALSAGLSYTLVVTQGIRDLDGEPLEASVTVDFTTAGASVSEIGQLAFLRGQDYGCRDLFVMNLDGSSTRRVTWFADQGGNCAEDPTWSPDGSMIAFETDGAIRVINADGSGLRTIKDRAGTDIYQGPAWSPDGTRIAFVGHNFGSTDRAIYVMDPDGAGLRVLNSAGGEEPAWSLDGRKIAFRKLNDGIWVMNADGSGATRLTSHGADYAPTWSPNGKRIAFTRLADNDWQIYVMNGDGSAVSQLTAVPEGAGGPTWSPDGTRIAFSSSHNIYLMNPDGTGVTRVTNHPASEVSPVWSPVPVSLSPDLSLQKVAGNSGDRQTDTVFATLEPFRVLVRRNSAPAAGIPVYWDILTLEYPPRARLSASTTVTDTAGVASVTLTLGQRPDIRTQIEASISGGSSSRVVFEASAQPGNPARVIALMGGDQFGVPNVSLSNDYIAMTTDRHGNFVGGVSLDWAVTSGGGSVGPGSFNGCDDMSCYFGAHLHSESHTLGAAYGPQTVTATALVPDAPSATFTSFAASAIISVGHADSASVCHNGFDPREVTVPLQTPVAWVSPWCFEPWSIDPGAVHDLIFEDGVGSSPPNTKWWSHVRTFDAPGIYRYRCTVHSTSFTVGEVGSVRVQ